MKMSLPQLGEENYFTWAKIMTLVLKRDKLWYGHIVPMEERAALAAQQQVRVAQGNAEDNGQEAANADEADRNDRSEAGHDDHNDEKWQEDDLQAMILLLSYIENEQIYKTVDKHTARDLWEALEPTSEADDIMRLEKDLKALKLSQFESVKAMAKKIKSTWAALLAAGQRTSMKEIDVVRTIVHGLPTNYRLNKVLMIDKLESGSSLSLDSVLRQLESAEQSLKEEEACNRARPGQSGFVAQDRDEDRPERRRGNRREKDQTVCHYCDKPGHYARECRKKKADKERANLAAAPSPIAFTMTHERDTMMMSPGSQPFHSLRLVRQHRKRCSVRRPGACPLPADCMYSCRRVPNLQHFEDFKKGLDSKVSKKIRTENFDFLSNFSFSLKTFSQPTRIRSKETSSSSAFSAQEKGDNDRCSYIRPFILDSGATGHYSSADRKCFTNYVEKLIPINTAMSGQAMIAQGVGDLPGMLEDERGDLHHTVITNVMHVPTLDQDLFSMVAFIDAGANVKVTAREIIVSKDGLRFSAGPLHGAFLSTRRPVCTRCVGDGHHWRDRAPPSREIWPCESGTTTTHHRRSRAMQTTRDPRRSHKKGQGRQQD